MKQDFERIYRQLKYWGLAASQYEFSTRWLGQCPSYYSSIKARGFCPNPLALVSLMVRLQNHNEHLLRTDLPRTNNKFAQLSSMLELETKMLSEQLFQLGFGNVASRVTHTSFEMGEF